MVDAFFLAARGGNFDALVSVLDPDVVLRIDAGAMLPAASKVVRGAASVANQALAGLRTALARLVVHLRPALVNGAAGVVVTVGEQPMAVIGFTVVRGKIAEIDAVADLERVRRITASVAMEAWRASPWIPEADRP